MIADVVLEQEITHEEVRDRKEWMTSSEAFDYVLEKCPNIWKSWGMSRRTRSYKRLYDMVDKYNTLSGKAVYDSGHRYTRFYLQEDLDDIESSVYSGEGETEESLTAKHLAATEISNMYGEELELIKEKYRTAHNEQCRIYDKREFLRTEGSYAYSDWYNKGGYQRK